MAILPDHELKSLVEKGSIYVKKGPDINSELQVGPASIDLRLGYSFGVLDTRNTRFIDTRNMDLYQNVTEEKTATAEDGIVIHPGEFVLGATLETVNVPANLVARIEGRSSYARLGIIPHAAAGYLDPGFEGQVTLEIQNLGNVPVTMYPEDRVCQVAFETLTSPAETPYGDKKDSKYMGQEGATGSRLEHEKR